jgi:hypothetical protein
VYNNQLLAIGLQIEYHFANKISVRLEYLCTNSQIEYEAFQFGLQNLIDMSVKNIYMLLGFASGSATI